MTPRTGRATTDERRTELTVAQPSLETLGLMLVRAEKISREQLYEGLKLQRATGRRLGDLLFEKGWIDEDTLVFLLAKQAGFAFLTSAEVAQPDRDVTQLLDARQAWTYRCLPVRNMGKSIMLAISDQRQLAYISDLEKILGIEVSPALVAPGALELALIGAYGAEPPGIVEPPAPEVPAAFEDHTSPGSFAAAVAFQDRTRVTGSGKQPVPATPIQEPPAQEDSIEVQWGAPAATTNAASPHGVDSTSRLTAPQLQAAMAPPAPKKDFAGRPYVEVISPQGMLEIIYLLTDVIDEGGAWMDDGSDADFDAPYNPDHTQVSGGFKPISTDKDISDLLEGPDAEVLSGKTSVGRSEAFSPSATDPIGFDIVNAAERVFAATETNQLVGVITGFAQHLLDRVIIFRTISKDRLEIWQCSRNVKVRLGATFTLTDLALLQVIYEAGTSFFGPPPVVPMYRKFFELLQLATPTQIFLAPVVHNGATAAIVYGETTSSSLQEEELADLEMLVKEAGTAWDLLEPA